MSTDYTREGGEGASKDPYATIHAHKNFINPTDLKDYMAAGLLTVKGAVRILMVTAGRGGRPVAYSDGGIARVLGAGTHAVKAALRQLRDEGFCHREGRRGERGREWRLGEATAEILSIETAENLSINMQKMCPSKCRKTVHQPAENVSIPQEKSIGEKSTDRKSSCSRGGTGLAGALPSTTTTTTPEGDQSVTGNTTKGTGSGSGDSSESRGCPSQDFQPKDAPPAAASPDPSSEGIPEDRIDLLLDSWRSELTKGFGAVKFFHGNLRAEARKVLAVLARDGMVDEETIRWLTKSYAADQVESQVRQKQMNVRWLLDGWEERGRKRRRMLEEERRRDTEREEQRRRWAEEERKKERGRSVLSEVAAFFPDLGGKVELKYTVEAMAAHGVRLVAAFLGTLMPEERVLKGVEKTLARLAGKHAEGIGGASTRLVKTLYATVENEHPLLDEARVPLGDWRERFAEAWAALPENERSPDPEDDPLGLRGIRAQTFIDDLDKLRRETKGVDGKTEASLNESARTDAPQGA